MVSHHGTAARVSTPRVGGGWWPLVVFTAATYGWTWSMAGLIALLGWDVAGTASPLFVVAVYGPSLIGVLLTARYEGRPGLRRLWCRVTRWRVPSVWYLVVLVAVPLLVVGAATTRSGDPVVAAPPAMWPVVVVAALAVGPLGEEIGWRGFALPRLLDHLPALPAACGLGVVWGIWHLPAFWLAVPPFDDYQPVPFVVGAVLLSVMMTGVYLATGHSVLVGGLLVHTVVNACMAILHVSPWSLVAAEAAGAALVWSLTRPAWRPPASRSAGAGSGDTGDR